MKLVLVVVLGALSLPAALVRDIRAELSKDNRAAAKQMMESYKKQSGVTSEYLEALSWFGRDALARKRYDQAEQFAADTRTPALEMLKKRKLDADSSLPLALGASIEVHAQTLAATGRRSEGISFLKQELARWFATSIRTRIQKNLHLLSLEGTRPPPLEMTQWFGPSPKPLDQLKGKPVLLFFWAHWCGDCKQQGPILAQLRDRYAAKDLQVVAPTRFYGYVAGGEDATPDREKPYIDKIRREFYPGLLTSSAPLSNENFNIYGVSTTPTLVLLDRNGIVRMYHPGRMTYEELANEIDKVVR
ncbi:MAG: TlpA family protein disulfide reductase [Acidobacteria bacterium]|nr:TlpA family protein disulfide reductase [Acidobacteriota bacterium]